MRTSLFASRGALACAIATLACARPNELPEPPDVSPIVRSYEHPDGLVESETIERELPIAVAIARGIAGSGVPTFVHELLSIVRDSAAERIAIVAGDDLQSRKVRVEALLRVRRVCNGIIDASSSPDPARNGVIALRAIIRDDRLQPTVWGNTVGRCVETVTVEGHSERFDFDGQLAFHPHGARDGNLLVRIGGRFGVRDHDVASAFDFRLMNGGGIELRAPARGGWIVFHLSADAFGVRGSNGDFTCSVENRVCSRVGAVPPEPLR